MNITIKSAVGMLLAVPPEGRNLQMPGDPHYQPKQLRPLLGYDARVGWQVIVAWFWMQGLAERGFMTSNHAELLTEELLQKLLTITTTEVTEHERKVTNHDIIALLHFMKQHMPEPLHRYLHAACTSYDIISTAYALQVVWTFRSVMLPQIDIVDRAWREHIQANADVLHSGRTHLQTALPTTIGYTLAVTYSRFKSTRTHAMSLVGDIPGKFSGAVGTRAATVALFGSVAADMEHVVLRQLGLPHLISTQITQPEPHARFYYEMVLMSGALSQFGNDIRHLQMSEVGEVHTISSTSSAMSHKTGNPISAENVDGMFTTVRAEHLKVTETLVSTLQRDLTGSNVMRGFPAILVFTFQQLLTTERIFKSLKVDAERCRFNFDKSAKLVVSELLHLSLQLQGIPDAHKFVNEKIMPLAKASGNDLCTEMNEYVINSGDSKLIAAWEAVPHDVKHQLIHPETYLGDASKMAKEVI